MALKSLASVLSGLESEDLVPGHYSLELLGFSKGGVVITRLIQEIFDLPLDKICSSHTATKKILARLQKIHFVDTGHNGATSGSLVSDVYPLIGPSPGCLELCHNAIEVSFKIIRAVCV